MKKSILALVLVTAILLGCGTTVMALTTYPQDEANSTVVALYDGLDTLSLSQAEYEGIVQASARSSDSSQIESLCQAFLATSRASVRVPAAYSSRSFVSAQSLTDEKVQYRLSEYEYLSALYDALNWEITSDALTFTDFTVDVEGNNAIASIVESYTYYITDGFGDESFRRREYTVNLSRDSDGWEINSVTSNDPWELEPNFGYEAIDVESEVSLQLSQMQAVVVSADGDAKVQSSNPVVAASLNKWTYDTDAAVSYAVDHYADTSNSTFGFTSGNNCQNFSSQCVWAGLGGSGSSTTARPAVSTSRAGSSAFNVWCRNQNTTYYSDYYFNWAWDNVRGFAKLMRASSTSAEGPYGNAIYSNGIQNADVGNVLSVDWNGSPSESTLDHAMFVTQVSGTAGSRTKADVKIAAHTSATNSAYQTVSSYTSQSIGSFARSYITSGYYAVAQP